MMDNEQENMNKETAEEQKEESPSLLEMEERLANNEGEGIFACPQCGTGVTADATHCPECNALFDEVPAGAPTEEAHMPSVADLRTDQVQNIHEEPQEEPEPGQINPDPPISRTKGGLDNALADYYERRKKRYLLGALSMGLGIILFVMLWLVVVHQVVVVGTDSIFGFEVLMLLVSAGIFFILGLYLTLTYPSSSLTKLLASMSLNMPSKGRFGRN
jgi:hypothetical protein